MTRRPSAVPDRASYLLIVLIGGKDQRPDKKQLDLAYGRGVAEGELRAEVSLGAARW